MDSGAEIPSVSLGKTFMWLETFFSRSSLQQLIDNLESQATYAVVFLVLILKYHLTLYSVGPEQNV